MATVTGPTPRWRLAIELNDKGRGRIVSLDYAERAELERQLGEQLRRRGTSPFGRLMDFTNEFDETLSIVAAAYAGHTIVER